MDAYIDRSGEKKMPLFDLKAARKDPASSHAMAKKLSRTVQVSEKAKKIYDALAEHQGSCSKQLAALASLDRYDCARYLPLMRSRGYVKNCSGTCPHHQCIQGTSKDGCDLVMFVKYGPQDMKQIRWFIDDRKKLVLPAEDQEK